MADATLPLNPVTPLWNGAQVSTANAWPVQLFTSALQGWTYTNIAVSGRYYRTGQSQCRYHPWCHDQCGLDGSRYNLG